MLPQQRNKVDINSLSAEEQRLFRLYGKLPSKRDILQNKLKERKYFDSGDYALSKAGKASDVGVTNIGSQHPLPENIPHIHSTPTPGSKAGEVGSPIKEHTHLHSSPMASEEPVTAEELEREQQQEEELAAEKKVEVDEKEKAKTEA